MKCDDCIHKSVCYRIESVSTSYADKCGDFGSEKTGHWKKNETIRVTYCSECGFGQYIDEYRTYNYCPNCGAKMEREE